MLVRNFKFGAHDNLKSLVYQMNSIVVVVSPLNVLIRDKVTKLKRSGLKACILKATVLCWVVMTVKKNS